MSMSYADMAKAAIRAKADPELQLHYANFCLEYCHGLLLSRMKGTGIEISYDDDAGNLVTFAGPYFRDINDIDLLELYRFFCELRVTLELYILEQRRQAIARKAAKAKAERQQATDPHAWMIPYFERAYAELDADGYAQIGRRKLSHYARQLARQAGLETSRRREVSERRAEAFLKQRENELI